MALFLSSSLGPAYGCLFSSSDKIEYSPLLKAVQPPAGFETIVSIRKNVVLNSSPQSIDNERGLLILSSFRLIFIPRWLDIDAISSEIFELATDDINLHDVEVKLKERSTMTRDHLHGIFESMDFNHDGSLSREEFTQFLTRSMMSDAIHSIQLPVAAISRIDASNAENTEHNQPRQYGAEKMEDIQANIVSFAHHSSGLLSGSHYVYTIAVGLIDKQFQWTVSRRYSEFVMLRKQLFDVLESQNSLPPLPPKAPFKTLRPNDLEARKSGLSKFLEGCLMIPEYRNSIAMADFLHTWMAEDHKNLDVSSSNATVLGDLMDSSLVDSASMKTLSIASKDCRRFTFFVTDHIKTEQIATEASTTESTESASVWCEGLQLATRRLNEKAFIPSSLSLQSHLGVIGDEAKRLGIETESKDGEKYHWRFVDNSSFELCSSYPAFFLVPAEASDELVAASAKERSKGRIPSLTWKNRKNGACLLRAAQPLAGLQYFNAKSLRSDEKLLEIVRATVSTPHLEIIDCRPKLNAEANALKGGGWEHEKGIKLQFMGIGNIHAMRQSLQLLDVAIHDPINYYGKIAESKWESHLAKIIASAYQVASLLSGLTSTAVLIHCSDGWDRTSQLCALSQLLLDPFYRTLKGFCTLVSKDFGAFGHVRIQRAS